MSSWQTQQNGQKYKLKFVVVEDKDADINFLGCRAGQQMNLVQVNHKNMQSETNEVRAVNN